MFYIWLTVVILLTLVEVITVNLTTIWFVISGIVTIFVSLAINNFLVQFGTFTILGIVLLVTTRSMLQKRLLGPKEPTNLDRVIGMTGVVTETIQKNAPGEVKVDGKKWTAIANQKLEKDTPVKIIAIEGVKLKVKKEENV